MTGLHIIEKGQISSRIVLLFFVLHINPIKPLKTHCRQTQDAKQKEKWLDWKWQLTSDTTRRACKCAKTSLVTWITKAGTFLVVILKSYFGSYFPSKKINLIRKIISKFHLPLWKYKQVLVTNSRTSRNLHLKKTCNNLSYLSCSW